MARVDNTGGAGYVIDNGTGAAVRTKLNQIAAAINSLNSGSGDPSINSAFQPHIDTGSSLLKIRNSGNTGYVNIGNISLDNLGHVVAASPVMTGDVSMNSNGFLKVPVGTDAQQPGQSGQPAAALGQFRYNQTQNRFEGYKNTGWGELGGGAGATGGGTDQVFLETGQTITENYQLSAGKNAITVSPTINTGKEVVVPNGATLVIL